MEAVRDAVRGDGPPRPHAEGNVGARGLSMGSGHGLRRRRNVAIFGGGPEGPFFPLLLTAPRHGAVLCGCTYRICSAQDRSAAWDMHFAVFETMWQVLPM